MHSTRPASTRAQSLLAQFLRSQQQLAAELQSARQPATPAAPSSHLRAFHWLAGLTSILDSSSHTPSPAQVFYAPLQQGAAWPRRFLTDLAMVRHRDLSAPQPDTLQATNEGRAAAQPATLFTMRSDMDAACSRGDHAGVVAAFKPQQARSAMLGNRHNMFCQALVAWAHLGEPAHVADLLQDMAGMGLTTGAKLHKSVIQGLVSAGKHEAALEYLLGSVPAALNSNAHLYNSILAGCLDVDELDMFQAVLAIMQARAVPWDPRTWALALRWQALLLSSQGPGKPPGPPLAEDPHVQFAAASARASRGDVEGAAAALQQALQRLGAQQAELPASLQQVVLAACHSIALAGKRAGQEHIIPDLLDSLEQVGLTGDTAMYNVLLRLGARRGKSSTELHSRFQGMAALGVAPDQHTHVILLQACAAEANAGLALVIWQAMLDAGIRPGVHAWNAMVQLRAAAADSLGAADVYQQMRAAGVRPDVCTFIYLLRSVKQPRMTWEARQRLSGLGQERGGRFEDLQRHSSVLVGQAAVQQVKGWARDFQQLQLQHVPASFTAMVQAFGHTGHIKPMLSLLHSAWQPGARLGPNTRACNAGMAACARRGSLAGAQDIKRRMDQHGLACTVHTYTALLQAIASCPSYEMPLHGRKAAAADAVQEMRLAGISPNTWLYNAQIQVSLRAEDVQHAMMLVDSMPAESLQPDEATWSLLLEAAHILHHDELRAAVLQRKLTQHSGLWQQLASSFSYSGTATDEEDEVSSIW